ncbi:MAG: cytochrome c [Ignavibacteriaceae bacterium]|jgi:cytochrome c2|nr:cytochrome c [Ignavibacteriaceae bacterium]
MLYISFRDYKEKLITFIILLLTFNLSSFLYSQSPGETAFKGICQACHTIGKGKLVGPDLVNIQDLRPESWLIKFIKSSQSMVNSGDHDAVAVFNEYNKTIMPDQNLSDAEIKDVLSYIKQQSTGVVVTEAQPIVLSTGLTLEEARDNEFTIGRNLFSGEQRLTNGGPACISCHNVVNDEVASGGLLALDLTNTVTRLSVNGVHSIISSPPFPVMKAAYTDHQITEDEQFYLTAFLKNADFVASLQDPAVPQQRFLYAGIVGGVILFGIYGSIWWNRKRKSVNDSIFNRQLKSI